MATEVADLYVVLRARTDAFVRGMDAAGKSADSTMARITNKVAAAGKAIALAGVGVAAVSVDLAKNFDMAMTRVGTLAHVGPKDLAVLQKDILNLAGVVGFSPTSLAEALYHAESSFQSVGITASRAMQLVTIAAKGAQIGGANLVDVQNALDAAIVSGIPGVQDMSGAMGQLLAIVGSGDMTMQNLADALGTGVLAIGKQYGATLSDVGAALATFGDNNIRGAEAATYLRMVIMDLTKQSATGQKALANIGITTDRLARDMQQGGLNRAITDLRDHLNAAKITGSQVGQVLEDAFTKRSSAPLAVLLGEYGQFESKFADLKKGADDFAKDWGMTQQQFAQQWNQMKSGAEALGVELGNFLIPKIQTTVKWVEQHKAGVEQLAKVLAGVAAASVVVWAGKMVVSFARGLAAVDRWLAGTTRVVAANRAMAASGAEVDAAMAGGRGAGGLLATTGRWLGLLGTVYTTAESIKSTMNNIGGPLNNFTNSGSSWYDPLLNALHAVGLPFSGGSNGPSQDWYGNATTSLSSAMKNANGPLGQTADAWLRMQAAQSTAAAGLAKAGVSMNAWVAAVEGGKVSEDAMGRAIARVKGVTGDEEQALDAAAQAYFKNGVAASGAADATTSLGNAINGLQNLTIGLVQAQDGWYSALQQVGQGVQLNGTSLDRNTAAGLANHQMLVQVGQAALSLANAEIANHEPAAQVYKDLMNMKTQFEQNADKAGYNATQVKALADQLFKIPPSVTASLNLDTSPAMNAVTNFVKSVEGFGMHLQTDSYSNGTRVARWIGAGGGWIPGAPGSPQPGIGHGGEYVLSTDMLSGRAPVDPKVLAGILSGGRQLSGGGTSAARGSLITAAPSPAVSGGEVIEVRVYMDGKQITDAVRTEYLRHGARNAQTYQPYRRQ